MGVAERLRRLDNRVLGQPEPATTRAQRNAFLIGAAGTVALLAFTTVRGGTGLLPGSGGFLGVMVVSAARWYRAASEAGHWHARPRQRRLVLSGGLALLIVLVAWYAALFARADEPRYTQAECDAARSDFVSGEFNGRIDDVLSECARGGR